MKEARRLAANGRWDVSQLASNEAELLRVTLERDLIRFLPVAGHYALIIQREWGGRAEQEGEREKCQAS